MKTIISAFLLSFRRSTQILRVLFPLLLLSTILFTTSCTSPNITYFPVQKEGHLSLLTLMEGKLIVDDGLLRARSGDTSYLLIWPYGYSYRISGSKVEVLNEKGEVAARTGQRYKFGGGSVPSFIDHTGKPSQIPLPAPYFLVGDVVDN